MTVLEINELRLDKWLWAARFFKTRQLACEAVNGGKVHLNGQRTKPSKPVHVDDTLTITRGLDTFHVTVQALAAKRGPAKFAQTLYQESEESLSRRESEAEQRRLVVASQQHPKKRPDKRSRRRIIRFQRKDT